MLDARRDRLAASNGHNLPTLIGALVLVGALVILGYATLVAPRSAVFHAIGGGAIGVVVGFPLVVLVALQVPLSGRLAVDPSPFKQGVLAQFFAESR